MRTRDWNVVWLVLGLLLAPPVSAELSGPQLAQRGPSPPDCEVFQAPECKSDWNPGKKRTETTPVPPGAPTVEPSVNRGGGDYAQFDVASPEACRTFCWQDPSCRAYTFVMAGRQGPNPRCWLKSVVPPPQTDNCCVSGVKQ